MFVFLGQTIPGCPRWCLPSSPFVFPGNVRMSLGGKVVVLCCAALPGPASPVFS